MAHKTTNKGDCFVCLKHNTTYSVKQWTINLEMRLMRGLGSSLMMYASRNDWAATFSSDTSVIHQSSSSHLSRRHTMSLPTAPHCHCQPPHTVTLSLPHSPPALFTDLTSYTYLRPRGVRGLAFHSPGDGQPAAGRHGDGLKCFPPLPGSCRRCRPPGCGARCCHLRQMVLPSVSDGAAVL